MDTKDRIIQKAINGLNEAIGLIRGWHGMGMPTEQEERMWNIYNTMSPEMKRINELVAELSRLKEEPEVTDEDKDFTDSDMNHAITGE